MTTPIRINCDSTTQVPSLEKLRELADVDHHVVLQFPGCIDKSALISELRAALPEHSVFDSGGNSTTDWVTVMPVVSTATVLAHAREIGAAVTGYIEACSNMLAKYTASSLAEEWSSETHGDHRRFENDRTGQIIEAPLDGAPEPSRVDPYFLASFAKSTPSHEVVARLLKDDFHDAARMLDILFRETGLAQPGVAPTDGPATQLGNAGVAEGTPPAG